MSLLVPRTRAARWRRARLRSLPRAPRRCLTRPLACWRQCLLLGAALLSAGGTQAASWSEALAKQVEQIDKSSPGSFGLYVKRLDNGETYAYQADRPWYLASSAKLPVAIALLQEVEAGKRRLDETVVLKETDKIDGSGNMVWQKAGASRRLDDLLERMLMVSDNTAANMLVRTLGEDTLNRRAAALLGPGFGRITNFAQIRYDVYAELHPSARKLSHLQLVQVAAAPVGPKRVENLQRVLGLKAADLQVKTLPEAYGRYYARNLNMATLEGYGGMLEKLVRGQLLSEAHMKRLYTDLKYDSYDAYRLEAGLPKTVRFIHKTGTQFERACHMGVIDPQDGGRRAIVVATCAQGLDEHAAAGAVFERLGRAITATMLAGR